ncbi:MAG: peroxide stress protein YaaA [Candidatus Hydrogenedentota bacterium]
MIVLLPPSEGKSDVAGTRAFKKWNPGLYGDSQGVLKHLRALPEGDVGKFVGVKNAEKALAWRKRNLAIAKAGCVPALERYTGVVFTHLDYATLKAKKRACTRLYVVSGLFGVISGATRIPEYKMPMNSWLARYWMKKNTARIGVIAKGGPVVSLLSQSYAKAHGYEAAVHVDFKVQGGKKSAGHFGKAIKGRFVRFLIENDVKSLKDFDGFTEEGFRFDGENFVQD